MHRHQISISEETNSLIETYALEQKITKLEAAQALVSTGYELARDHIYASGLAGVIREEMRGELAMFERDLRLIAEEFSEEVDLSLRDCAAAANAAVLAAIDSPACALPRDAKTKLYTTAGARLALGESTTEALAYARNYLIHGETPVIETEE